MDKQREIRKLLAENGDMTLGQIVDRVPFGYYCNASKHVGDICSRMVKTKLILRVKKGVFRLNGKFVGGEQQGCNFNENQTSLF